MLTRDQLPEDNADLANIPVEFPRLDPDTAGSCPIPLDGIVEYLRLESPDGDAVDASRLRFLRTACVAQQQYWIWEFCASDGAQCYATVAISPDGASCIGCDQNAFGLTPEQFMLGDYHEVF